MSKFKIIFQASGRGAAQCAPDPNYPNGKYIPTGPNTISCKVTLPYPAKECGIHVIECMECERKIGVTAAGRPDDPTGVDLPCNLGDQKSFINDTITKENHCLKCNYKINAAGGVDHNHRPFPGAVSICINCAHIMMFDKDLSFRELTEKERKTILQDPTIVKYLQAIKHVQKFRPKK